MDWRRVLLWIAFFAIVGGAILLITRVAKIAFAPRIVADDFNAATDVFIDASATSGGSYFRTRVESETGEMRACRFSAF